MFVVCLFWSLCKPPGVRERERPREREREGGPERERPRVGEGVYRERESYP